MQRWNTTRVRRAAPFLRRSAVLAGLGVVLMALPGCQSIAVNYSNAAQVRFIAASVDAPGLDFYFSNTPVAYNIGFGTVTSYAAVNPGQYTVNAEQSGTRTVLASSTASLAQQAHYTVLVGNVAAGLQESVLADQPTPAPSGSISVRFLDQATRAGAVDVYLVPSSGKLSTTAPLVTGLSFSSNTGYINVPAGTYAIAVVPSGTVPVSGTTTLLTGAQVGYGAGAVRTIVLLDAVVTTVPGVQAVVADDYDSPNS